MKSLEENPSSLTYLPQAWHHSSPDFHGNVFHGHGLHSTINMTSGCSLGTWAGSVLRELHPVGIIDRAVLRSEIKSRLHCLTCTDHRLQNLLHRIGTGYRSCLGGCLPVSSYPSTFHPIRMNKTTKIVSRSLQGQAICKYTPQPYKSRSQAEAVKGTVHYQTILDKYYS